MNEELYQERYRQLNAGQQQAVDTIYGPVMVIAGPGTGKTEVLSMRIANLLRSDAQVAPGEILCLTYTEEAAVNMRRRLLQVVGQAAHKVNIGTFHSFCNSIIQSNTEYFGVRSLDVITDLERVELMQAIIDGLPKNHPMHRVGKSTYYDISGLRDFFSEMKKENWNSKEVKSAIKAYLEDLPNRDQYRYKTSRGNLKKGDIKQNDIDAETERMQRTMAAADLFDEYNLKMAAIGRYDFSDMILWVIDAFKRNPSFLQRYQERFQYILVDEFQDTNGAQNELLTLLTNYWEDPNIFVVGDDDQSIYEFQGARIRNIVEFYERHKNSVNVIVLTENYRSSQAILDKAAQTINANKQRLIHAIEGVTFNKDIIAAAHRFASEAIVAPVVTEYYNVLHEEVDIVRQIEQLKGEGVDLGNIAVIYAQHKQADNIIALMERKMLPYTIKRSVDILELPLIGQILKIMSYLHAELKTPFSAQHLLFELLHAPYLGIEPTDLSLLSLYMNSQEAKEKRIINWRTLLNQELLLSTMELRTLPNILRTARNLDIWIQQSHTLTLPMLVEKIVYDTGIASWLLKGDDPVWQMQVLQTFFSFVKELCVSQPHLSIEQFLTMLEKMRTDNIDLPVQRVVYQENGVQFYTAHSSKGNEFEYVFLMGCTKDFWENKSSMRGLKLPDTLTRTVDDNDSEYKVEVARRLFYVALTRAKKHLYVSYASRKNDGKPLQASMFVDEISSAEERQYQSVPTSELLTELENSLKPVPEVYIALADKSRLAKLVENFVLSVSSLSKYLKCPVRFYYEDILKTPIAENDDMAFGVAIHYALERAFKEMLKTKEKLFPPVEEVLQYFRYMMRQREAAFTPVQYERRLAKGLEMLEEYYKAHVNVWSREVEPEKWIQGTVVDGVPLKGKIDRIEKMGTDSYRVIDYKTGSPDNERSRENLSAPNEKTPLGGDYWRQMVFYKILLENQPYFNKMMVQEGVFEYIEKSKKSKDFKSYKIPFVPTDEIAVREQIKAAYTGIRNLEFDKGCGDEDCNWCNFARTNNIILDKGGMEQKAD